MKRKRLWLLVGVAFLASGCAAPMTRTEQGTAVGVGVGAATGAILGQAIGGNAASTALGAVAGAAAGGIAGNLIGQYMDKQERDMQQALANSRGATVQRQRDELAITFRSDMLFDVNSTVLKPGAYDEIDRVADILNRYPQTRVQVNGYTDSTGSEQHNYDLSERRAQAVRDALINAGVHPNRIVAQGFGETRPVASNATETGRQLNRRVAVVVIPIQS